MLEQNVLFFFYYLQRSFILISSFVVPLKFFCFRLSGRCVCLLCTRSGWDLNTCTVFFFLHFYFTSSLSGRSRWCEAVKHFPFFCAFSFLILFVVFGIHIVFPSPHPSRVCVCLCWYPQSILRWSGIHYFISCISCEKNQHTRTLFLSFFSF